MSDENDTTTDPEQESELVRNLRKELEQQGAALSEERKQRKTLEKTNVFRDVGVDPTKGPGKLLFEAYDGPPEPDAVKAKAEEYGITLGAPAPDEGGGQGQPVASEQEQAAMREMDRAGAGGNAERLPADPQQAAREAFDREYANTGSRDKAMAASFNARMIAKLEADKKARR